MSSENPIEERMPLEPDQTPVYFAGGFGYDQSRNERVREHLTTLGHQTVPSLPDVDPSTIDRGFYLMKDGEGSAISRGRALRLIGRLAEGSTNVAGVQRSRAQELIGALEQGAQSPVNAVLQSADALNGLLAAAERPELFSNLVLAYPGGIIKQPKPIAAAKGILASRRAAKASPMPQDSANNFDPGYNRKEARKVALRGMASSIATAASVTLSYQGTVLSELRERSDSPGVALVLGTRDWMIRPELAIAGLESSEDVDYILVTDTSHGINGRQDVMDATLALFPKMEARKAARQSGVATSEPLSSRIIFLGDILPERQAELLAIAAQVDIRSTENAAIDTSG